MGSISNKSSDDGLTQDSRKTLGLAGMKVTTQRALILEIMQQRGHLDANEIYRLAQTQGVHLSLSTVYRNLQKLKEEGLIEELHYDDSHHHYEVKPSFEHQHLVCLGCGRVMEFKCPLSSEIKREIAHRMGFEVTGAEVRMMGYCSNCQRG